MPELILPPLQSALADDESRELYALARGRRVLEMGTYFGKSAIVMAQSAAVVHTVDNHRGDSTIGYAGDTPVPPFLVPFFTALHEYGLSGKVCVHVGDFDHVVTRFGRAVFDMVFHDGDHTFEAVQHDLDIAHTTIVPGGTLAVHDYGRAGMDGVKRAVDAHVKKHAGLGLVKVVNTLAVIKYPE